MNEAQKEHLIIALKSAVSVWFGGVAANMPPRDLFSSMHSTMMSILLYLDAFEQIDLESGVEDLGEKFNRWLVEGAIDMLRYVVETDKAGPDVIDMAISMFEPLVEKMPDDPLVEEALAKLKNMEDEHNPRLKVWRDNLNGKIN